MFLFFNGNSFVTSLSIIKFDRFLPAQEFFAVLFMNECRVLSNAFSESTEMMPIYHLGLLKLWAGTHFIIMKYI